MKNLEFREISIENLVARHEKRFYDIVSLDFTEETVLLKDEQREEEIVVGFEDAQFMEILKQ